ncbi:MAG: phosphopantetheine-binding protein [Elusimicrobiota bacterium]|jgi:acyl carrier protein|nr:phosphopantetheine-binding protein [Elusimicrobiota bacterium]
MQREEIIKIVNDALVKEFELDPSLLTSDADFVKLGLDSLDAVDMVITLEQAFKIDIRNNYKVGDFGTLGGLYDFIERLLKQKQAAA